MKWELGLYRGLQVYREAREATARRETLNPISYMQFPRVKDPTVDA